MAKSKAEEWLTPEGLLKLQGWARDGLTDDQIAHNMGIARSTFYDYKSKYTDFSDAIKQGKEVVDRMVENALLKRALGYEYDEVTTEGGVETRRVRKQIAPDTTAQIFWLKNRKPGEWRDKREVDANVTGNMQINFAIPRPVPLNEDEIEEVDVDE